jgi:hypothetical protein
LLADGDVDRDPVCGAVFGLDVGGRDPGPDRLGKRDGDLDLLCQGDGDFDLLDDGDSNCDRFGHRDFNRVGHGNALSTLMLQIVILT